MRSPLTRSHLNKVEEKNRKLEAFILSMIPNADVEKIVSQSNHSSENLISAGSSAGLNSESDQEQLQQNSRRTPQEDVPDETDGFDWMEGDYTTTDGMAALSIDPKGKGYFGLASSSVILRALRVNPSLESSDQGQLVSEAELMKMSFEPVPRIISSNLIDSFFRFYNSTYPILHEETFRAQCEGLIAKPKEEVWNILYYMVLALGSWCINNDSSNADMIYYHQARRYFTPALMETGNLALVQALMLIANFLQKRNKPNTGWNYLGLAIQMALALGLYREFPSWKNSSPLKLEMRRRVWWCLYYFDSGASVTFGRPISVPREDIVDIKFIQNLHDHQLNSHTTQLPIPLESEITPRSSIIIHCKLCLLTDPFYMRIISANPPSAKETLQFNRSVMIPFISNLPPYMRAFDDHTKGTWAVFARYQVFWRIHNLQIVMFRPFVMTYALYPTQPSTPEDTQCRDICLSSARVTISLVEEYFDPVRTPSYTSFHVWYALYYLFQAALIPIIFQLRNADTSLFDDEDVVRVKHILVRLMNENQLAVRFYNVIERLTNGKQDINDWINDIFSMAFFTEGRDENDSFLPI